MVIKPYPLNPNCSNVCISSGNLLFVYFYYTQGTKRKQAKFQSGLNEFSITKKERDKRVKQLYNSIHDLLTTKVYDGKDFNEINKRPAMPSFNQAAEAFIDNRKQFVSERSITNYDLGLGLFKKYLLSIGKPHIQLDCIDGELLEDYIVYMKTYVSSLYKKPLSKFTIKEYKDRVGAVLEFWHTKKRVLSYNPMKSIRLGYELRRENQDSTTVFTVKQVQDIIDYTKTHRKPPYLTLLLMIYYTHMRPTEICRLQVKDVDMDARMIYLKASKSKTRIARKVPIDIPMYKHFINTGIDFKDERIKEKYFFSYHGNARIGYVGDRMYNHKNMTYGFKKMLDDLGLDRNFSKYHLKHVHEIVYEGMSFAEVQSKNGHTLSKTTEVYLRDLRDFYINNRTDEKDRVLQFDI